MKNSILLFILFVFSFQINAQKPSEAENLGAMVNTKYSELAPVISADGKLLYFIVQGSPENYKFKTEKKSQEIWYSELDKSGKWGEAKHAPTSINKTDFNAAYWISPDGNRILIRGAYKDGKYVGRGVSMCNKTAEGWSEPEKLDILNYENLDLGNYDGAAFCNDGKTILFYFAESEGSSSGDIYVSFLKENGKWTEPMNLGKNINTKKYIEMSPFLASDGVTLYFSSDRPGGLGNNDIWMSKRLDDSWMKWSDPVNLGAPINTEAFDAYFSIDANSEYAYMVTSQNTIGSQDIVRIKLKQKEKPNPVVLVYGTVYNAKTKQPLSAKLYYETLPDGVNAGNALSSPIDGNYKIVLPYGKNYSFRANATNFLSESQNIDLDSARGYMEIRRDLYLYPIEVGQTIRVNNIFFDFAKSVLRPESFPELDRVVTVLNENPTMEIEMSGHTDNIGAESFNVKLSDDRAKSVRLYLLSKGISEKRVIAKGYGKSKPVASNDNEEGRQQNRRVEFTILKK